MLNNNLLATFLTLITALAWLRINDYLAHRGWINVHLSRKIIHMGTGPIFVLCWLLFPGRPVDRYLAAFVPGLITIQFALVGLGIIKDKAAVSALSRTGNPKEILKGPLYYGLIFVFITILYWSNSPIGILGLMAMCGGDGLAEILGRRFGHRKLPWSKAKSWIGSVGMFVGGWCFSIGVFAVFTSVGNLNGSLSTYLLPITITMLVCTLIESIPIPDIDNITISVAALVLGHYFF